MLKALGEAAAKLRQNWVNRAAHDTPPEQATTPSLEALQAYSLGTQVNTKADFVAAVHLL